MSRRGRPARRSVYERPDAQIGGLRERTGGLPHRWRRRASPSKATPLVLKQDEVLHWLLLVSVVFADL